MRMDSNAVSYHAITERQQATWATGDVNVISQVVMPMSDALVQAVDPHAGQRVLDIACGSGNAALIAGRRFCEVTGIDDVPALIERASMRAAAEEMEIDVRMVVRVATVRVLNQTEKRSR